MAVVTSGRRAKKRRFWIRIGVCALAAGVILFAFIWEAVNGGDRDTKSDEPDKNLPPVARSEVQDAISGIDWIIPAFLPINEFSRPGDLIGEVNAIVIHYIGNPSTSAMQNRNYFANLAVTGETSASSNFIIGLDGEIIQCVPVDEVAYASNYRNMDTISIENCHPDESGEFTEETYASAVRLTAWLCGAFGLTADDVLRHYDVTDKECPKYFVDNEEAWEKFKGDVMAELSAE